MNRKKVGSDALVDADGTPMSPLRKLHAHLRHKAPLRDSIKT